MNTSLPIVTGCSYQTQGSSAEAFDTTRLTSLIANRNSRFHLDLSQSTMIEVLDAKEAFGRRSNPRYSLSSVIGLIKRLEAAIGETIMPIDITDEFYSEAQSFLLSVPGPSGKKKLILKTGRGNEWRRPSPDCRRKGTNLCYEQKKGR